MPPQIYINMIVLILQSGSYPTGKALLKEKVNVSLSDKEYNPVVKNS